MGQPAGAVAVSKRLAGAVAPPSPVIPLNTYVNINIYSIRNINFTYFFFKYDDFGKE
jgi:hypothetical protein